MREKEARVIAIEPAGLNPEYRNQIGIYICWHLLMVPTDGTLPEGEKYSYSIAGLEGFDKKIIDEMFERHFRDIPVSVWLESDYDE